MYRICTEYVQNIQNLPSICFENVRKPFFYVSKSFFFVNKSFLNEYKPSLYESESFIIYENFFLTLFLFIIVVAVIGQRRYYIFRLTRINETHFIQALQIYIREKFHSLYSFYLIHLLRL